MNLFRPALLFWVCILALLGAATAGAQTPIEATFDVTPAQPVAGEPVTFSDTTETARPLQYAWDLDGDGAFDDGSGRKSTRAFPAGQHAVALRVRLLGAAEVTDVATRTITVAGKPSPTPTPTPEPLIDAPNLNLPPQAKLAGQCGGAGVGRICLGPLVQLDKPKTFDASESRDADGTIVRHQWDVDGDGTFEHDTGADPKLTVTVRDAAPATLRLRVTDDRGGVGETTLALVKLEPQCQGWMRFERVHVTSPCLRRYTHEDGVQYRSSFPVTVNGITIAPQDGRRVLVNVLGTGMLRRLEIVSGRAVAAFGFRGEQIEFRRGALHWKLAGHKLVGVGSLDGAKLNGLELAGAPAHIDLPARGMARTSAYLKLPQAFGGPTSERPVTLTAGSAQAAQDAFSFTVPSAALGPIPLTGLTVSYDGDGLWEIAAGVRVPVVDASIEGKAGILDGAFNYAGAEVRFGSPGIGPFGPVYLQRIKFRVEINPRKSECVPVIGTHTQSIGGLTYTMDFGVPTFALCGEVGLTGGPTVLGAKAVSLDAGLGIATYDDRPSVLRAFGNMKVVDIPFADATFEAHTDGFLKVAGRFNYGWSGFASINGHIAVGMLGGKFNAEGSVHACLDFVDLCRGVEALISSKGIAVCVVIDLWLTDWRPGFAYEWGDALPTPYFAGCSLGPYRETLNRARAASAQEQTVFLRDGLPGAVFAAQGAGGPPKLTLIGPKGERITTPDGLAPVEDRTHFLLKHPGAKLTQIAIPNPSAGEWRVVSEAPLTSLKVANGRETPKVKAEVKRGKLVYTTDRPVTFIERGASTQGVIATVRAGAAAVPFTPAAGAAERRELVAVVEHDGLTTHQLVAGSYRAPAPRRPAAVRRLRITRSGHVSWKSGVRRHIVTVAFKDGRRSVRNVSGRRFKLRGRGTVTVRAVSDAGLLGPARRAR